MAGKSTISITFKLDGDGNGFKTLAQDAAGLKQAITATLSEAKQLKGNVINFAALATGIDAAQRSFGQLQNLIGDLSKSYQQQEVVETQLTTVMRQRMNATDDEIASIKQLASEQQKLGVIGDEVQLAGAQQVATFLKEKSSIETLLPAMNNLLAQQNGVNATQSDAVSVANLMGKAMQGQVAALTRVGITFSEAEAQVLKYGTESERAAVLAQVITNNVGDMNAQLAATDTGKQAQLANKLGDIKERLGELANGAMPFVTITSSTITALASITTLAGGIKTLTTTVYASVKAFALSTAAVVKNKVATLAAAVAQKTVAIATKAWTAVQKVLNLVLSANPIGIVITAIGGLVAALVAAYNNSEDFRNICNQVWAVIKPLADAIMGSLVKAFQWLIDKAKQAWQWLSNILGLGGKKAEVTVDVKTTGEDSLDVDALASKYADAGKKTGTGGKATGAAAAPAQPSGIIGQLEAQLADARKRLEEATSEAAIEAINREIAAYESQLDKYRSLGVEVAEEVSKGVEDNGPIWKADAATLADISGNLDILQKKLQTASLEEAAGINKEIALWNEKAEAIKHAGEAAEQASVTAGAALRSTWGGLRQVGSGVEGITDAIEGNGSAWQRLSGIVDGFFSIVDGIKGVIAIIEALTGITQAHTAAKAAETAAVATEAAAEVTAGGQKIATNSAVAASNLALATTNTLAAGSGAASAVANIPYVGPILAIAALASVIGAIMAIPKFAKGGIAFGPTLGLFGEYAGAANNPEVVAPLDKLRDMLQPADPMGGRVKFTIEGRTLVGILEKETDLRRRS
jgi:hypothetical protein